MQSPNSCHFTTTERGSASGIVRQLGLSLGLILLALLSLAPSESALAAPTELREKGSTEEGYSAISDLLKRLGCVPPSQGENFEDLLQALGDCYAEHGTPPNPTPELREGIKRDVFRSLDGIHNPQAGISALTIAAFDDLLFQILADVTE